MTASTSTIVVCKTGKVTKARPKVFFKDTFTTPISLSQKPPYHGALLGMNFHTVPLCIKADFRVDDRNNALNSLAADV